MEVLDTFLMMPFVSLKIMKEKKGTRGKHVVFSGNESEDMAAEEDEPGSAQEKLLRGLRRGEFWGSTRW